MSATARELKAALLEAREQGLSPYRCALAFEAWFERACIEGRPPDMLQRYSPIESERFWARTVPGPDGHVYWTGGQEFARNPSATPRNVVPARWVWTHEHGPITTDKSVMPTCGEPHCVALAHLKCERREGMPAFIPDDRLLGRLQVVAMELGRTPSSTEWDARGESPTVYCFQRRWGSWGRAIAAAGLPPIVFRCVARKITPEQALDSLRQAIKDFGRVPLRDEYRRWCQAKPEERVSHETIKRRHDMADWETLCAKAMNGTSSDVLRNAKGEQ